MKINNEFFSAAAFFVEDMSERVELGVKKNLPSFALTAAAVYGTSVGIVGPDKANEHFAQAGQKLGDAVPEQVQENIRQATDQFSRTPAGEQTIEALRAMQDYVNHGGR